MNWQPLGNARNPLPVSVSAWHVPVAQSTTRQLRFTRRTVRILFSIPSKDDDIGVGIDLGTTNSAIAFLKNGTTPTIVSIPHNGRTIPSVVTFIDDQILVGKAAWDREIEAGGAYRNIKRVIGTGGKLSPDVLTAVPFVTMTREGKTYKKDSLPNQIYDATQHPTLLSNIQSPDQFVLPEVISSHILLALKKAAEESIGQNISRAVIGVPAYFNDAQREATKRAAEMAGIKKVKLLREPEAAALAYGIGKEQLGVIDNSIEGELVLVFDLGGGTFDVSMLVVGGGVTEILSTSGNTNLGGSVFDASIANYCLALLGKHGGVSTKTWSPDAKTSVMLAAEAIRIYLSNNRFVHLALPVTAEVWRQMKLPQEVIQQPNSVDEQDEKTLGNEIVSNSTHVLFQMSRKDMERLCKKEFQLLLRPIREVAIMSGALLPGDSSPSIVAAALELEEEEQERNSDIEKLEFADFYSETPPIDTATEFDDIDSEILFTLKNVEMKDAKKAQQQGRKRARDVAKQERKYRQEKKKVDESINNQPGGEKVKIRDGISGRTISRVVLVGGATRMPGIGRLLAAVTGVVPQKTVNPDEAVALGCAVHAGVLDGVKGLGTVLNPMQAAILRAVAAQSDFDDADFEDFEFDESASS